MIVLYCQEKPQQMHIIDNSSWESLTQPTTWHTTKAMYVWERCQRLSWIRHLRFTSDIDTFGEILDPSNENQQITKSRD